MGFGPSVYSVSAVKGCWFLNIKAIFKSRYSPQTQTRANIKVGKYNENSGVIALDTGLQNLKAVV